MKILLAVESTEASLHATLVAKGYFPDATLIVLSSAKYGPYVKGRPVEVGPSGFARLANPQALVDAEDDAERAVEDAVRVLLDGTVESIVDIGHPGTAICDEARAHEVDLIVVGRTEKKWVSRFLDPSVSDHVIRNAPCPVLVVRLPG
jgi:nucleotide-binding universal stress UspA family protein